MSKQLISLIASFVVAFAATAPVFAAGGEASTLLLGDAGWEAFAAAPCFGSLAWSGEDESFSSASGLLGKARHPVDFDADAVDPALLTGLPAPEPPAIVLAGLAFGGVLCGRSLVMRRRKAAANETDFEVESQV